MVYAYFEREVKPYLDDAWIDEAFRDDKDAQGRRGWLRNSTSFEPGDCLLGTPRRRTPEELARQIQEKERQIADLPCGSGCGWTWTPAPLTPEHKPSGVDRPG